MLFAIVLLALAAAGPVFSAPVPSTGLTQRQEPVGVAVERRHDALSTGAPHQSSKRLVPGWQTPERVQRRQTTHLPFPRPFPRPTSSSAPPPPAQTQVPVQGSGDPAGGINPPAKDEAPADDEAAPVEDEGPAVEDEAPAEGAEEPAENVEDFAEDVEEFAGDDGGEGTSTILDLVLRY